LYTNKSQARLALVDSGVYIQNSEVAAVAEAYFGGANVVCP
jgi:hypothetical protein